MQLCLFDTSSLAEDEGNTGIGTGCRVYLIFQNRASMEIVVDPLPQAVPLVVNFVNRIS